MRPLAVFLSMSLIPLVAFASGRNDSFGTAMADQALKVWADTMKDPKRATSNTLTGLPYLNHMFWRVDSFEPNLSINVDTPIVNPKTTVVSWDGEKQIMCEDVIRGHERAKEILSDINDQTKTLISHPENDRAKKRLLSLQSELAGVYPDDYQRPQIEISYFFEWPGLSHLTDQLRRQDPTDPSGKSVVTVIPDAIIANELQMDGFHWTRTGSEDPYHDQNPLTDGAAHEVKAYQYDRFVYVRHVSPVQLCIGNNAVQIKGQLTYEISKTADRTVNEIPDSYYVSLPIVFSIPQQDYTQLQHDARARINTFYNNCLINQPFHLFCDHS